MQFPSFTVIADICQFLVILLSLGGYIPQWYLLCRSKESGQVSVSSWLLWLLSSLLGWIYAFAQVRVYGTGEALLAASSLGVLFILTTIALVLAYRAPVRGVRQAARDTAPARPQAEHRRQRTPDTSKG